MHVSVTNDVQRVKVPQVIKIRSEFITTLSIAHRIIFRHKPRIHSCICRQEFENSVELKIILLHVQPFTNSHFHFLVIVKSEICEVWFHWPKSFSGVALFREWSGTHVTHLPVDSPNSRGSDGLNPYQYCAGTYISLLETGLKYIIRSLK